MPTPEHIVLESDLRQVAGPSGRAHGPTRKSSSAAAFAAASCSLRSSTNYYLSVRSHSRSILLEYVLDLRFVDAPRRLRHIAWRWDQRLATINGPGVSDRLADLLSANALVAARLASRVCRHHGDLSRLTVSGRPVYNHERCECPDHHDGDTHGKPSVLPPGRCRGVDPRGDR